MLDIKIIVVYLFISSISYRFLLFPKKIASPRGAQLASILAYDILLVLKFIPFNQTTFMISGILYFTFLFYPQLISKSIFALIMKPERSKEENNFIEKKLKTLFILSFDFKAFKYEHGLIEYFLKMISENTKRIPKPANIKTMVQRRVSNITYILMIIVVTMFTLTYTSDDMKFQFNLIKYGGNFYELVSKGEYYRLFTSMFLHGGITHLLMNAFALFYLGIFVERIAKTRSFYLSIFVVGGVLASMSSFLLAKQNSVGASGAIFALIGAIFSIVWVSKDNVDSELRKKVLRDVIFIIAINIGLGLSIENIDNYAHMGGLISGAVITYILYKLNNKLIFRAFDVLAILIVIYSYTFFILA